MPRARRNSNLKVPNEQRERQAEDHHETENFLTNVTIRVGRASRPSRASIHLLALRRFTKRPCRWLWLSNCTHGARSSAGRAGRPSHSDLERKERPNVETPQRESRE